MLRAALRTWFEARGRSLAFRQQAEPWGVLVSEVMAQQTQISRVEVAWVAFMALFPTPAVLAEASTAAVLRAWAGMGYNRRALNLKRAAATIVDRHGGVVPRTIADLEALPGIGPYTARAVAAIAFGAPVAAVDTNVRRVVGRVVAGHGVPADPGVPLPPRVLQAIADTIVDPLDPAAWTHAVMDLGATLCRPSNPRCDSCPLAAWCAWRAAADRAGTQTAVDGPAGRPQPRRPANPVFPSTQRWLRGRIVAAARGLPDDAWLTIGGPIGQHDVSTVAAAVSDLVREGMLESRPDGAVRLPST